MSEAARFASLGFEASAPPPGYINLVGPRRQQMLDADAAVKRCLPLRARGTPEYEQALEAFRRSPLTGCTSVLDLVRHKTGYQPATPDLDAMFRFVVALHEHPLFHGGNPEGDHFDFDSKKQWKADLPRLIERYKGTDAEAARRIAEQLNALYDKAKREPNHWHLSELLMEHSLGADDAITFYMGKSLAGGLGANDVSHFRIVIKGAKGFCTWEFDSGAWPNHAEAVLQEHLKLVEDWLDQK